MKDRILVVDDDRDTVGMLETLLQTQGYDVLYAARGDEALALINTHRPALVISDICMPTREDGFDFLARAKERHPDIEVIMMTAYASVESAIEAMRLGAYDYLAKPILDYDRTKLVIQKALEKSRVQSENTRLRRELKQEHAFGSILGKSAPMLAVFDLVGKVAATDTSVLIEGESGTGKELVARAIHFNSPVRDKRFVAVDCGLIPSTLLESELFGYAKGAFTGAAFDKPGLIEEADGGTLFLDELADTEPAFQAKLLRVIQEREIRRVGEAKPRKVGIRLITATNRPLDREVAAGKFRQDLYYRIKIIHILLPPLRRREGDVMLLAGEFLKKFARQKKKEVKKFSAEAVQTLLRHAWPGNVRELQNAVEHAVTLCQGAEIRVADLPDDLAAAAAPRGAVPVNTALTLSEAKDQFERQYLMQVLEQCGWNVTKAAAQAGVIRQNFQKKMKQFDITRPREK